MDGSTFRAIHKYGAVLSVVGTAIAVFAYVFRGPNSIGGLLFGWAGPLGLFYFGGAYLSYATSYDVVGEELIRGVAWYFVSLVAWSVIVTGTVRCPQRRSPGSDCQHDGPRNHRLMVTTRDVTGSDLRVKADGGQLLALFAGSIVFGFLVLYLVFADRAGWWLLGRYLVSIPAGLALLQAMRERYPNAFGTG